MQVELRLTGAGPSEAALAALGVERQIWRPDLGRAQLAVPPAKLDALLALPGVASVDLPTYAHSARGSFTTEGDVALRADLLRQQTGLTGAGVRIGVISDGIDGLAAAQASGDLPSLADQVAYDSEGIDSGAEGTAMLEIVHDVAPEAALYFANASTDLEMIEAVNYLAERTDVVVDDLGFFFPDDQQSNVSLNTALALNNPDWPIRAYLTAVGNWARRHYEGQFRAGPDGRTLGLAVPGPVHLFGGPDGATDQLGRLETPYNEFFLATDDDVRGVLFWDDPWGASTNDYDLLLLDEDGNTVAAGTSAQGITASTPRERISFKNEGPSGTFRLIVQNVGGQAESRRLELFAIGPGPLQSGGTALNFNHVASSMLAQSDAGGGVISITAVGPDPAELGTVRSYSSRGPTNNGAPKPDLTAVDGVQVTGSAGFGSPFFGTSAAAPHVAAMAALLLEARPQLLADPDSSGAGDSADVERALLRNALTGSAVDLGDPGIDNVSGAGRVDALAAFQLLEETVLVVDQAADDGPGSLREAIEALNAAAAGPLVLFIEPGMTIELLTPLPPISADSLSLIGGEAVISGSGLPEDAAGLVLRGNVVSLESLTVSGVPGAAIRVEGGSNITIDGVTLDGNGVGLHIDGGAAGVGIGTREGVTITGSAGAGVVVAGPGTRDVTIQNSNIGQDAAGRPAGNAGDGVRVEDGATNVVVGAAIGVSPVVSVAQAIELVHTVRGRVILNGQPAAPGTVVEALLDGQIVAATVVGLIDVEGQPGFVLTVPGPGLIIRFRVAGEQAGALVFFESGALSDIVLDVTSLPSVSELTLPGGNTIAFNAGAGLSAEVGGGVVTNRANVIHSNAGGNLRVSAAAPASPTLTGFRFSGDRLTVEGRSAPGTTVDVYVVEDRLAPAIAADPSAAGGALRYLGTATTIGGGFLAEDLVPGSALSLTALATDAAGNTSAFGANLVFGPGPRIDAISPIDGTGAGGAQVTLEGAGFGEQAGFRAFFGGRAATVVSVTDTRVVLLTPAQDTGPGSLSIEVSDGRTLLLPGAYTFLAGRVVELAPGWNNVTWSGRRTLVTAAIASLAARVGVVYSWRADTQIWESFIAGAPAFINTLSVLETGQALWLFVAGDGPLSWAQPLP